MRHLYRLLIFVGLVLHTQCRTICKPNQYTVVSSNGSFVKCLKCATCHPGRGLYPLCGSRIPDPPDPDCKDCPAGEFSDELDSAACHSCQRCAEHEIVTALCTSQSNTICSGTCEAGFFYSKEDSTHSCKKCSHCCLDGKDEEIPECANKGLEASKQHCRLRPDKDCSPGSSSALPTDHLGGTEAPGNGFLSSSAIIGIALGFAGGVIVALAVGICLYMYKTRKKREGCSDMNHQSSAQNYARNGPAADFAVQFNNPSCAQSNNMAGSQEGHYAGTVEGQDINGAISGVNLNTANEQTNQNATHSSLPNRNNLSEPDAASVNLIAAKDNTRDRKPEGDSTALSVINEAAPAVVKEPAPKDEAATSDLQHNTSKDSQRSGNCDNNTVQVLPQGVAYHLEPRIQAVQINTGFAATPEASPSVTPQQTDDELEGLPDVTAEQKKRRLKRQSSKESQSNGQKKDGTIESLLDPSVHVQAGNQGEDSKGVGQSMPRNRSFEKIKRKLSFSRDYQPLPQEDPVEPRDDTSEAKEKITGDLLGTGVKQNASRVDNRLSTNVRELPYPVRREVCSLLNIKRDRDFDDFRMLAEKAGIGKDKIHNVAQMEHSPTHAILTEWSIKSSEATVGKLIEMLKEKDFERMDVVKVLEDWVYERRVFFTL